ncbi:UDP-N-acetylmuramate dehydrogenase [Candidatus Uhrbacteria bacterium]|nr:UDP-N-acetylmuramate dehydrogenase [Candidatus Uhrbacteria bacterium]
MLFSLSEKILLAPYTTFGIGGPARYFATVTSEQELIEALEFAQEKISRIFVLGGGSNILVSDAGFDGLVIHNRIKGFEFIQDQNKTLISCGAGEGWDDLVSVAISKGLSGVELLSGIPGTVGAAPVQNIGAYGASVDSVFYELSAYDRESRNFKMFSKKDCQFDYRSSIFKRENDRYIITHVTFCLSDEKPTTPLYHDLKEIFGENVSPSLAEIRDAVIHVRAQKGMVILPGHVAYKSAGSFFQNPVVSKGKFEELKNIAATQGEAWRCKSPWYWKISSERVKVSAACLIQHARFSKGYRVGDVGLSERHTLAIVNYGNATSNEVRDFTKSISDGVEKHFSVTLEPEVQYIGF